MKVRADRYGNSGPSPNKYRLDTQAVALASATGMALRGFHSKNSSSTPISTEARGAAKVADMPAAAPATSRVFRSTLVK